FICCHPLLPPEAQTALALKVLGGFGVAEIASAFLTTETAIAKRLTRAHHRIRELHIPFEIPGGDELSNRLNGVLQTLYLLFNEGYKASSGDSLIKEDLCREAIRLTSLLAEHPAGNRPRTHALIALMLLNAARLPARVDSEGNILRLKEQDRSTWDQAMIARGMWHLSESAAGDEVSTYHLQAGIAACHCAATNYESTDWRKILSLYDQLLELDNSPIVALNRTVAVANVHGPAAGIEAVEAIENGEQLRSYYLLYAVLGEFERQLNHFQAAIDNFRTALELTALTSERSFLSEQRASHRVFQHTICHYALSVVSVAVALAITLSLGGYTFRTPFFFPAIILSTWIGGIGPGMFAVFLSTLAINYFILEPKLAFS